MYELRPQPALMSSSRAKRTAFLIIASFTPLCPDWLARKRPGHRERACCVNIGAVCFPLFFGQIGVISVRFHPEPPKARGFDAPLPCLSRLSIFS
jgi:hypothetical protein